MATLAIFAPHRDAKTLVGEPPQTRLAAARHYRVEPYFGTFCPKEKNAGEQHKTVLRQIGKSGKYLAISVQDI